jgi:hypothetical protein
MLFEFLTQSATANSVGQVTLAALCIGGMGYGLLMFIITGNP